MCAACGASDWRSWIDTEDGTYVRCTRCGLGWLENLPNPSDAATLYDSAYFSGGVKGGYVDYAGEEALHRRNARARLLRVTDVSQTTTGRWLDVGCAHGFLLDEARAHGWSVEGIDVSPAAAEWSGNHLDLKIHHSFESLAPEMPPFDLISFFQSLEHVTDPALSLASARARIRDDGVLVIETWDAGSLIARILGSKWHQANPPSVLYLFDRGSMERILERSGFRLDAFRRTSKSISLEFGLSLAAEKAPFPGRQLLRAARHLDVSQRSVRYGLGDLVTVFARPIENSLHSMTGSNGSRGV